MVVSKNSLSLRHNNKVLTLKFTTMDELQNISYQTIRQKKACLYLVITYPP